MRGAGIRAYNGAVELLDVADPAISAPDHLRIEGRAAGVGNGDNIVRTGGWDVGSSPPMALGVACAGVVRAAGGAVSRFGAGDEVLTHCVPLWAQGTWAELLVAPEEQV